MSEPNNLEQKISELLEPILEELGVDLLKVSAGGGQSSTLLQILLDCRGGVQAEQLARVSRALSLQLDVEDIFHGEYRLEVSSPGLDYPLESPADFDRYAGDWIQLDFFEGASIEGSNLGLHDGFVHVQEKRKDKTSYPQQDIRKVTRAIDWSAVSQREK